MCLLAANIDERERIVKIKTPPDTRWELTLQRDIKIRKIVVDSSGASNGISSNTTGGTPEGISIKQLPEEGEGELHKSFEESGNDSGSQLVCSGQFRVEKKQTK